MSTTQSRRSAANPRRGEAKGRPLNPEPSADGRALHQPDYSYLGALTALVSSGMIMMYSTNAIDGEFRALIRLGIGLVIGAVLAWVFSRFTPAQLKAMTPLLLVVSILALLSLRVLGPPLVVPKNGAIRWITLPGGLFTIQPSEYTKLPFVLFAAGFLDRRGHKLNAGNGKAWLGFIGVLAVLCGLIYKQPDLGTALVIAGTAFCMLVAVGIDWKKLFAGVAILAALVGTLAWNTPHQKARLLTFTNPWEHAQEGGYQVVRSWTAMARGGLTGVGLGQSTFKLDNRLPEAETDFIFAIVAEELGLIRAVVLIGFFGWFVWRGFGIAARAPDRYTSLLVSGITSWVAVQCTLNLAVATGSVPNTGVPLPFISSGLSSLTALMAASGVVIGISMRTRPNKQ